MNNKEISIMLFIYNALNDGWIVKKLRENEYEFIKNINNNNYLKNIYLDDNFLNNFINNNLKLENI
tara:strand:+ start:104 stop:301 length:198 start_codon:yes stop_codon:yes gene_type:complete